MSLRQPPDDGKAPHSRLTGLSVDRLQSLQNCRSLGNDGSRLVAAVGRCLANRYYRPTALLALAKLRVRQLSFGHQGNQDAQNHSFPLQAFDDQRLVDLPTELTCWLSKRPRPSSSAAIVCRAGARLLKMVAVVSTCTPCAVAAAAWLDSMPMRKRTVLHRRPSTT